VAVNVIVMVVVPGGMRVAMAAVPLPVAVGMPVIVPFPGALVLMGVPVPRPRVMAGVLGRVIRRAGLPGRVGALAFPPGVLPGTVVPVIGCVIHL
jgi:hypothetical protein